MPFSMCACCVLRLKNFKRKKTKLYSAESPANATWSYVTGEDGQTRQICYTV